MMSVRRTMLYFSTSRSFFGQHCRASSPNMSESLKELWTSGRTGTLRPLETMKAWAFFKVYLDLGFSRQGLYEKIASKVTKIGGGHANRDGIRKLLLKIEKDDDWYPGKVYGEAPGRTPALSGTARACIKRSAEAMKAKDLEPTYPLLVASNPNAARNPDTGEPVDKKVVYEVLRSEYVPLYF